MTIDEKIKRINELYHKSKVQPLSDEEKSEQKRLRQDYVNSIKQDLQSSLDSIRIQGADGKIEKLKKKS